MRRLYFKAVFTIVGTVGYGVFSAAAIVPIATKEVWTPQTLMLLIKFAYLNVELNGGHFADQRRSPLLPYKDLKEQRCVFSNLIGFRNIRKQYAIQNMADSPQSVRGEGANSIFNEQWDIPLDFGLIERQLAVLKDLIGIAHFDVAINFVTSEKMRELNWVYRKENVSTDILTFPYHSSEYEGEIPPINTVVDASLGDIFLDPKYIQEKCNVDLEEMEWSLIHRNKLLQSNDERGVNKELCHVYSLKDRIPLLLLHGLLHLLRYDHENEKDYYAMVQKEEAIIKEFKKQQHRFARSASGHHIIGVGTDICQISRFYAPLRKYEHLLLNHICSPREMYVYQRYKERHLLNRFHTATRQSWDRKGASFFAKRFAAKEAFSKALGTGLRYLAKGGIRLTDVELLSRPSGQPEIELKKDALKIANRMGISNVYISLSDEMDNAVAFVTVVGSTLSNPPAIDSFD